MYKAVKPTSNLRPARQRTALGNGILEHARPLFVRRGSAAEPKTVRTTETKQSSPFLLQRWPQPLPGGLLIALTHGGMARLSGLGEYRDRRPTEGHQSQY